MPGSEVDSDSLFPTLVKGRKGAGFRHPHAPGLPRGVHKLPLAQLFTSMEEPAQTSCLLVRSLCCFPGFPSLLSLYLPCPQEHFLGCSLFSVGGHPTFLTKGEELAW